MPKTYKWSDRHIFSDRFMMEASYAHVGNNFALTFHDEDLRDVQPAYEIDDRARGRAPTRKPCTCGRPTASTSSPTTSCRARSAATTRSSSASSTATTSPTPRACTAATPTPASANGVPAEAQLYRRVLTEYGLHNRNVYLQDSYTAGRTDGQPRRPVRLPDRLREPRNTATRRARSSARRPTPASTTASPTRARTFNQLPGHELPRREAPACRSRTVSPRLGAHLRPDGQRPQRRQVQLLPLRQPARHRRHRRARTTPSARRSSATRGWTSTATSSSRPTRVVLHGRAAQLDQRLRLQQPLRPRRRRARSIPNLTAWTTTNELLVTFDKQIGNDFAVSASYIWRKYSNFAWSDDRELELGELRRSKSYTAGSAAARRRRAARRSPTTSRRARSRPSLHLHEPAGLLARLPAASKLTARKRMSKPLDGERQLLVQRRAGALRLGGGVRGPDQHRDTFNGGQYAPESTSSGLGNVFVNAKWIFRVSGVYQTPLWDINVCRLLQRPQRLPVHPVGPDADAARSAPAPATRLPRQAGRQPPAELPDARLPRRQVVHAASAA